MTTCAYDKKNKLIAIDSRMTANGSICTDKDQKWIKTPSGDIYFTIGSSSDAQYLLSLIENGYDENEVYKSMDCILVKAGDPVIEFFSNEDGYIIKQIADEADYPTYGSGRRLALAAMDMGKTAKQAVEYAMTRDIYTGGKVRVYDIKKGKFING